VHTLKDVAHPRLVAALLCVHVNVVKVVIQMFRCRQGGSAPVLEKCLDVFIILWQCGVERKLPCDKGVDFADTVEIGGVLLTLFVHWGQQFLEARCVQRLRILNGLKAKSCLALVQLLVLLGGRAGQRDVAQW
jgi:hypothetical protein